MDPMGIPSTGKQVGGAGTAQPRPAAQSTAHGAALSMSWWVERDPHSNPQERAVRVSPDR